MTLRLRISHPLMPTISASRSSTPSIANCAWFAPKPRNAPQIGLFVRTATDSHVDRRHPVRAARMARPSARAPSSRRSHRRRCRRPRGPSTRSGDPRRRSPPSTPCGSGDASRASAGSPHARACTSPDDRAAMPRARHEPGCSCPPCRRTRRRSTRASTVTASVPTASTRAMSSRSSQTPWPPEYTCRCRASPSTPTGTATVDSGSRNACSMRCVRNTSCTVCADAASAGVDVAARRTRCDSARCRRSATPRAAHPARAPPPASVTGACTS